MSIIQPNIIGHAEEKNKMQNEKNNQYKLVSEMTQVQN